jgi:hypothetical protein
MDLKSVISGIAVSLAGFFGCAKHATPAATAPAAPAQAQSAVKDLGVLQMTNHYETCVSFGKDKDCRMIPKIIDRKSIQITMTFESKSPDGKTSGLSVVQMTGSTQKPFEVSFGNTDFTFTPQIATE